MGWGRPLVGWRSSAGQPERTVMNRTRRGLPDEDLTSAQVVVLETNRLRRTLGREPDLLELTEAMVFRDEVAEAAVIQAFMKRRAAYPATVSVELLEFGLVLEM